MNKSNPTNDEIIEKLELYCSFVTLSYPKVRETSVAAVRQSLSSGYAVSSEKQFHSLHSCIILYTQKARKTLILCQKIGVLVL